MVIILNPLSGFGMLIVDQFKDNTDKQEVLLDILKDIRPACFYRC